MARICPVCHKNTANYNKVLGLMPCDSCNLRRRKENTLPDNVVEMVGNSIKDQRKEFAKSVIQPYRGGELSKEYIDAHGTKGIKATPAEIKKAKNVWTDITSPNFDIKKSK